MEKEETKKIVRQSYAKIAKQGGSCCAPADSCCGSAAPAQDISKKMGYSEAELRALPEGTNLGLGCGNPVAIAALKKGETVLDLGSGAGLDCFLAAEKVGKEGKVIGVDMTQEMVNRARANARKGDYSNVEFRLGEIEDLPVADSSVDVVISNCVINLSPDKPAVFREVMRVLKPGGRLMVSDIVLLRELPDFLRNSVEAYAGCISGAITKGEYLDAIKKAGFQETEIIDETRVPVDTWVSDPVSKSVIENLKITPEEATDVLSSVASIKVKGYKRM